MPEYSDSNRSNYFGPTSKPKKPSLLAQSRYNPRYDEPYDPRTRHNSRRTKRRPKIDLKKHPTLKTYDQIAEEAELISESNQPENLVAFNYLNAGENALYDLENLTREEKLELTEDAQRVQKVGQELLEGALYGDFNDDPTFWAAVGQIVTGFIPIAGQLADFRDLIHALDDICNQKGYKKIMDLVGDNIIAPIAKEGEDLTANVVKSIKLTILDLLESAKNLARQLGAEVNGAIDDLIGQERLRLQTVGEGAGNVSPSRIDNNGVGRQEPLRVEGNSNASGHISANIRDNLSDSELIATVQKGYANPGDMNKLLARTDLPGLLQQARKELSTAITLGKYSSGNIQRVITQLRSAKNADEFAEALAELSRPNRLIRGGKVADDSKVILGAKEGTQYPLGTSKIDPAPVPDADVLYKGADGKTYIEEVKNTASALRQKLNESPKQLERLGKWLKKDPDNRAIRIVIETETGWTEIFAGKKNQPAVLTKLIKENVPLSIGSYDFSIDQMRKFPDAIASKAKQMMQNGTCNGWKEFYNQMPTPAEAEQFLGISLK